MLDPQKLSELRARYEELSSRVAEPDVASSPSLMSKLGPELRELSEVIEVADRYESLLREKEELQELIYQEDDPEFVRMAKAEYDTVVMRLPAVAQELARRLIPRDKADAKDAIVEIRAGTGGNEAALFAGDLYRLYNRYAERHGWKVSVMNESEGAAGGFKEVIFEVSGRGVFGLLKYESGVHRVQRVPETEASGRLHTSAATVAVLAEEDQVNVVIAPNDLKMDVYRSSGPGGQSVNTTDSAVRLTHIPTGLVVTCQDEKSQHKNKDKAMRVLRSRLRHHMLSEVHAERDALRRSAIATGDRSDKIRTYNFPQDRVTDHRLTGPSRNYSLRKVIDGDLDPLLRALRTADNAERLVNV